MSATYFDILKDRMYTFPKNSPLRRGSQMVLYTIVTSLAQLMAPILSFTAEDVWDVLPGKNTEQEAKPSVHLETFPDLVPIKDQEALEAQWKELLAIRTLVLGALEQQRREKVIGSSLEAKVTVTTPKKDQFELLSSHEGELPALFIVSQVSLKLDEGWGSEELKESGESRGILIKVERAEGHKCERCWNYRPTVGVQPEHPTLCARCVEAVS